MSDNDTFTFIRPIEVTAEEYEQACEAAQNLVKLGRLRAYLRPILKQQAMNVASAAACSISDFEAMKRGREMLERIENESEASNETSDQQGETGNSIPPAIRVALLVVLNHVEPGWENCVTVLRLWLEGARL